MPARRRGNLLLSALFMAAFLFFLSVALVVTNREDIQYTLFVDHRMRASLAAEGMLDYSLTVMRETQDWEGKLRSWRPGFASGAVGEVQFRSWTGTPPPADSARYVSPSQGSVSAVELIASAGSGLFKSERHLLLEEFRFADSLLVNGGKPHLFALTGTNLQVLTPSFAWEAVGPMPTTPLPLTISAGGEQLHYLAREQGVKPPVIQDFSKISVAGIFIPSSEMTSSGVPQIPVGHGGSVLVLKEGRWAWEVLPDPGEQLGTVLQPAIGASDPAAASSKGSFDALTLDWDVIARTPSELTVPYEYFNGPRVNWYSLTGTRAEVSNGVYTCHGIHHFYSGFRFKNTPTADGRTQSQGKDNSLFEEPCLLQYNVKNKKWTVMLDFLKVEDMLQEPLILPGIRPDPNTLLVADGRVYCRQGGAVDNAWYEVQKEKLQLSALPKQAALFPYQGNWLYTDELRPNPTSSALMVFNRFHIAPYFPSFLPALNPDGLYDANHATVGQMEPPIELYWDVDEKTLTGYSKDFFCIVKLVCLVRPPLGTVKQTEARGLAHFDGVRWQLLPAGLAFMLSGKTSYRREMELDYAGGAGPAVGATRMVLGGYASDKPLLRRYLPVARWGPG